MGLNAGIATTSTLSQETTITRGRQACPSPAEPAPGSSRPPDTTPQDHLKDMNRLDVEPMEFEWKIFPLFTTFGLLELNQEFMKEQQAVLRKDHLHVNVQRHCMGKTREPRKIYWRILLMLQNTLENSRKGIGRFGPGSEKKWHGTHVHKLEWEKC